MKPPKRSTPFGLYLLAGAVILAAACSKSSPSEPVLAGTLALHPGDQMVAGGEATVTFVGVTSDSRCPSDVQCPWAGNAAVVVTIRVGAQVSGNETLNTGIEPHSVDFAGYRVRLDSLQPHPVSTKVIEPDEYMAHFTVSRLGGGPR